jgi:hypothetical protein
LLFGWVRQVVPHLGVSCGDFPQVDLLRERRVLWWWGGEFSGGVVLRWHAGVRAWWVGLWQVSLSAK